MASLRLLPCIMLRPANGCQVWMTAAPVPARLPRQPTVPRSRSRCAHVRSSPHPPRPAERLHPGHGRAAGAVPARTHRRHAGPRPQGIVRAGRAAGQHRELHRRGAGADRPGRPAAHQRRARAGRLLRAARHHRGHAGGELQPRHARAHRVRRRHRHGDQALDAARTRVHVHHRARGTRLRRVAGGQLRRHQGRRGIHHPDRQAGGNRAVPARQPAAPALQLTRPATPPART